MMSSSYTYGGAAAKQQPLHLHLQAAAVLDGDLSATDHPQNSTAGYSGDRLIRSGSDEWRLERAIVIGSSLRRHCERRHCQERCEANARQFLTHVVLPRLQARNRLASAKPISRPCSGGAIAGGLFGFTDHHGFVGQTFAASVPAGHAVVAVPYPVVLPGWALHAAAPRPRRPDTRRTISKKLWSPGPVEHHGVHYQSGPLRCEPLPVQCPHPPIWVGGHSRAALRRTARFADGWHSLGSLLPWNWKVANAVEIHSTA
jgi:hypothetical protein